MLRTTPYDSAILAHHLRKHSRCVSLMTRRSAIFIAETREFHQFLENSPEQPGAAASDRLFDEPSLRREPGM